ncbi:sodium-dependent proline transporter-like isoform X2 [Varroa destructor]|uniref:Transporter n=1 Tax=Varroa destructor TaxID=109461 RepID=A0A7M7KDG2_VARDE|nr:sodium-dependent proline transporter-like isoform X2 [Varroa destructor]
MPVFTMLGGIKSVNLWADNNNVVVISKDKDKKKPEPVEDSKRIATIAVDGNDNNNQRLCPPKQQQQQQQALIKEQRRSNHCRSNGNTDKDEVSNNNNSTEKGHFHSQEGEINAAFEMPHRDASSLHGMDLQHHAHHHQRSNSTKKGSGGRRASVSSISSRGNWGNRWEFLLSCVGLSVGIGNVWRFPYLAYKNGGGAFLIPYLVMLMLVGKPMYFMELAFGQFAGQGPLTIWACSPFCKGVGMAMIISSLIVCVYYNVVMCYTLYFMGATFQAQLPWEVCDPSWVSFGCYVRSEASSAGLNQTNNSIGTSVINATMTNLTSRVPSSQLYWERTVLDISTGIENLNGIKWDLALCLLISWIIVIACLLKGIKTSGKVVYFAATFPYVILLTLMVTGLLQKGAMQGVFYFITPDFKKLLTVEVWQAAAGQMFFSLGVSGGGLIMYSSYNRFGNDVFRDAMIVSVLDTVTSIIAGLVIFSVLGAMAHELNVKVEDVVQGGPGLAFVAYPEALARLPCPQLWSVLFFLMLFILGLDSEFALLENFLTGISDAVPQLRRHKMIFTITTGVICFFLGLPFVTRGGQYVLEVMDKYGGSTALIFIAICECIAISWVYGYKNIAADIHFMLDKQLGPYWKWTWGYTAPAVLVIVFSLALIEAAKPLEYGFYVFPPWANAMGWCVALCAMLQIPLWAFVQFLRVKDADSLKERLLKACQPSPAWGPSDKALTQAWRDYTGRNNIASMGRKAHPNSASPPSYHNKVQLRNYAVNLNGNGCGATGLENAVCSILDERPKAAINKNDENSARIAVKSTECDTVRQRSGSDSSQEVFTTVASNPKTGFTSHATIGMYGP